MSPIPRSLIRVSLSVAMAAAVCLTPAFAGSSTGPSPAELIEALKSKGQRGVQPSQAAANPAEEASSLKLIETLREKATRGLSASTQERQQLASIVEAKPNVNLEVPFEFNSADLSPKAVTALGSLGKALQDGQLSAADILVAGHTDAKGRAEYNQTLSQRRAEAVREYLVKNFNIPAAKLIPVGYGREKLKVPAHPFADENRRVQVVNLSK
jgi:outer membrane protein OmpA-like peptidoglycan-associated protein